MKVITKKVKKCIVCSSDNFEKIIEGYDYQYKTSKNLFFWYKCKECSHLFLNPVPNKKSLHIIYPKNIGNYEGFYVRQNLAFRIKSFLEGLRLRRITSSIKYPGRILDVGCASGDLLDTAKKYCNNIKFLEGFDISEAAVRSARKKGYKVYVSSAEKINLKRKYYDVIILQQVIEHLHDPGLVLKKLNFLLKDQGIIIIETPNPNSIDRFVFGCFWEGYHIPRHFNLWNILGMKKMLLNAGFKSFNYKLISKPAHWTVSIENILIHNKKFKIAKIFSLTSRFPLALCIFAILDYIRLYIFKTSSGVQYIASKNDN